MQKNNSFWLGVGILVALLLVGGIFLLQSHSASVPASTATSTSQNAATSTSSEGQTTTDLGNGVSVTGTGTSKIEVVNGAVPRPSLNRAIVISTSTSLTADQQALMRSKIEALTTQLKAAPTRLDLWLQLGVDRKIVGDYQGAAEAWQYVALAGPTSINYIAYGNLGDLYLYFMKDGPKSELNYKKAIAIKPTVIEYYRGLYTLYHYDYKVGTSAAADIVAQGLKANPNNPDLLQLQQQLNAKAQ